jgi:hypothetical protein
MAAATVTEHRFATDIEQHPRILAHDAERRRLQQQLDEAKTRQAALSTERAQLTAGAGALVGLGAVSAAAVERREAVLEVDLRTATDTIDRLQRALGQHALDRKALRAELLQEQRDHAAAFVRETLRDLQPHVDAILHAADQIDVVRQRGLGSTPMSLAYLAKIIRGELRQDAARFGVNAGPGQW